MDVMERMWDGDAREYWHPKEELLDLMILCSSLGWRAAELMDPGPSQPDSLKKYLVEFADE